MFLSSRTCGGAGDALALLSRTNYVGWCAVLAVGAFRWVRTQGLTVRRFQLLAESVAHASRRRRHGYKTLDVGGHCGHLRSGSPGGHGPGTASAPDAFRRERVGGRRGHPLYRAWFGDAAER